MLKWKEDAFGDTFPLVDLGKIIPESDPLAGLLDIIIHGPWPVGTKLEGHIFESSLYRNSWFILNT